jgi:nucleoside-diphosphate-sugar epimerase
MRVFVSGATGVVGRRAVARLVAAGHEVTGIARSAAKAALLADLGADPVEVSLFDPEGLKAAVAGHDAVVNLATKIPPPAQMARSAAWQENDRIRREASGYLVDAALANGVRVFVQESLAFLYGEHGDTEIDATTSDWSTTPFTDAVQAAEANVARFAEHGGRAVVLRFGRFYAPDSEQTRLQVQFARHGFLLDAGRSDSYFPVIDVDDAASAVVAALDAPAGTYDVVDDDPRTRAEQATALAGALGRRRLRFPPAWAAPKTASHLAPSQRVSNRRFRDATTWRPASPNVEVGFRKLVRAMGVEPVAPPGTRLLLWILAFSAVGVGVQAAFFPRSFYDDFPMGRGWVALDGAYSEHLVRDVGALNLTLLVLTIGALLSGTRRVTRITGIAWLAYGVPHFVYHARHLSMMDLSGGEKTALLGSLAVTVVAPLVLALWPGRSPDAVGAAGLTSPREAGTVRVSRT